MAIRPRVYVTEDTKHNLSHAMEYGDITILEQDDFPLFRNGQEVTDRMRRKLSEFTSDDFILLIGDPILMGLAFALLRGRDFSWVKVLKWDRQSTRYIPITVPIK